MAASPWASEAALNALLKYAPQKQALRELRQAAEEQFGASVQAGKTEGTLGVQAARGAVAPTRQVFSQAQTEGDRGRALTAPALAALGPGNPFALAAANEASAGNERRANAQASALSDLQQRQVAASELPAFSRQQALGTLLKELTKLGSQQTSLEGQQAATQQSETQKGRKEAHTLAVGEREHREGNETSERDTAANNAQSQKDSELAHPTTGKNGVALLTPDKQAEGAAEVAAIKGVAARYFQHPGFDRAKVQEHLEQGLPSQSGKSKKTGNPYKTPAVPAYKPSALMEAALDELQYGSITRGTLKKLHAVGYSVESLGLNGPKPPGTVGGLGRAAGQGLRNIF